MDNNFNNTFNKIIEDNNLYGRSFTLGVALYTAMQNITCYFTEDEQQQLDDIIDLNYGDMLYELYKNYNINIRYNYRALGEMLDISMLDDIARVLTGEGEDEDE